MEVRVHNGVGEEIWSFKYRAKPACNGIGRYGCFIKYNMGMKCKYSNIVKACMI
jgi:hypothetical protein